VNQSLKSPSERPNAEPATNPTRITIARGDGIGPEIMDAVLRVLDAAGARLEYDFVEVGQAVYESGHSSGIAPDTWETIRRNKILLKAPITTPLGSGFKSLNVTLRKTLGLYANVRPTIAYAPYVASTHPQMDLVIVRENEEDLYAGIEHRQTREVTQVLKLITRPGTERIARYAFEYARAYGRKKVTCMTKENIMKITDGRFHRVFQRVAQDYPDIKAEHMIIDIGSARLAAQPEIFDVIVTLNLYGDILSDIASQIAGSVGLAGSANIGDELAMFEAIHGSAPDIAGRGIANPSGLLEAAVQMLVHVGQAEVGETIKNAWLSTLEAGIHTADIFRPGLSERDVSTDTFTAAVIERLGEEPETLRAVHYRAGGIHVECAPPPEEQKRLVGVDVFLDWSEADRDPEVLGNLLEKLSTDELKLSLVTNRGVKVYPGGFPETFRTDHWRCRFRKKEGETDFEQILELLRTIHEAGLEVIKTEHLYTFNGRLGFSLGQGE